MAKVAKVSIDNLSEAIDRELKLYSAKVVEGMKEANDECMKEFVKDTKKDAPRGVRKKHYYTYITSETTLDTPNRRVNTWYVKKPEYRLTHLIAFGHATVNGGRTKAQDFLTDNYNKLEKDFQAKIEEVIKNAD